MKKIKLLVLISIVCLVWACDDRTATEKREHVSDVSLAGKVYSWQNSPYDTICSQLQYGTSNEYFPKLLFVNDSTVIKIIPTTCGDLGDCLKYYTGKYTISDIDLTLTFDPKMVVYHVKSKNLATPYAETENADILIERLIRRDCKTHLNFEECDVQGHVMLPKSDTLENYIKYMEENEIQAKLFISK